MPTFTLKMRFLGFEQKTSGKTGNAYVLAKFMIGAVIYEFYVAGDRVALITNIAQAEQFAEFDVQLALKSFNNKPDVELVGFE